MNVKSQVTAESKESDSSSVSFSPNGHLIFQENPRVFSKAEYEHLRSFTYSLQSYELYAKKHYIQLVRNLDYTKQYPDFHIIITFQKQIPVKDFTKMKGKAFVRLTKWKVRGFYVLEATAPQNRLHIHILTIYAGSQDELREFVKLAWESSGLKYMDDFLVKVKPVGATDGDYKRLCGYILKFNGRRATNRHNPRLFIKHLGLRKAGSFGKWYAKSKKLLWEEYTRECWLRHGQQDQGVDVAALQLNDCTDGHNANDVADAARRDQRELIAAAFRIARKKIQERRRAKEAAERYNRYRDVERVRRAPRKRIRIHRQEPSADAGTNEK
jgi:hypothetical protein